MPKGFNTAVICEVTELAEAEVEGLKRFLYFNS